MLNVGVKFPCKFVYVCLRKSKWLFKFDFDLIMDFPSSTLDQLELSVSSGQIKAASRACESMCDFARTL